LIQCWGPLPERGDLRFANGPRCVVLRHGARHLDWLGQR
jgi:hypothetical protein